jgi:hypothetical protein
MQRRRWWKWDIGPMDYAKRWICNDIFLAIIGCMHRRFKKIIYTWVRF